MIIITKQSEIYRVSDTLENGWAVSGDLNKNAEGNISINISINKAMEASESENTTDDKALMPAGGTKMVGSYNRHLYGENINCNYSIYSAEDETEFIDTCQSIVADILAQMSEQVIEEA